MQALNWDIKDEASGAQTSWTINAKGLGYATTNGGAMTENGFFVPMDQLYDRILQDRCPVELPPGASGFVDMMQRFVGVQVRENLSAAEADVILRIEQALAARTNR